MTAKTTSAMCAPPTLKANEMTMNKKKAMKQSRRGILIREQDNQEFIFDDNLTDAEHSQVWYSIQEFDEMKLERQAAVKKLYGPCREQDDSDAQHTCVRGLERLLPGGKQLLKRRESVLRSIVKMYRQMHHLTPQASESESDERENVLRAFCLSKTRYAQQAANYLAAQDAAAVSGKACCCKQPSSRLRSPQQKVTCSAVNSRRSLSQRGVPLRALTA